MTLIDIAKHSSIIDFVAELSCQTLGGAAPEVTYTEIDDRTTKVRIDFDLSEETAQDDWQVRITPSFRPTFHWAPHLTPTDEHIIDQHSFRSPALVVQDAARTLALIPDLDILSGDVPVRWYMDLNAQKNRLTLGMSRYRVKEHVLYVREPGARYPKGKVSIGFYVMKSVSPDDIRNPWRPILHMLWERWGSALYRRGEPVNSPLEAYVRHAYHWAFESWEDQVWQQFELNGKRVGAPVFIVNVTQSPNYPGTPSEREFRSVWNQAWFSSLRSAQGLFRYGREQGNEDYVERARMSKELALAAPQRNGFFPSVIATEMEETLEGDRIIRRSKGWDTFYWGNSNRNPYYNWGSVRLSPYHVLDMSWTGYLMLAWHEELEEDRRLVDYARNYADALLPLQDRNGFFPAWLEAETLQPLDQLRESPETSMTVTFLLKLHELTRESKYKAAALAAMDAVVANVVPEGRWEDFETYWSCSTLGNKEWVGRKIERNNMYKQCNFSMFWTAEALLACYGETADRVYLETGERCLDELLMTQASWQPPYIYARALGGFGVMNADGEWNDSRQSLFAELIIRYGMALDREEYVERGLAALKCSFALMYCPENPEVREQWEKAHPFFDERDFGFMMENYGHGGVVDSEGLGMGEFTIYDWGNGAAAESYMRIKQRYGDLMKENAL